MVITAAFVGGLVIGTIFGGVVIEALVLETMQGGNNEKQNVDADKKRSRNH